MNDRIDRQTVYAMDGSRYLVQDLPQCGRLCHGAMKALLAKPSAEARDALNKVLEEYMQSYALNPPRPLR